MSAYVEARMPESGTLYCKRRPTGFYITFTDYEPCRRLAAGSQRGVIEATGVGALMHVDRALGVGIGAVDPGTRVGGGDR